MLSWNNTTTQNNESDSSNYFSSTNRIDITRTNEISAKQNDKEINEKNPEQNLNKQSKNSKIEIRDDKYF